MKGAGAGRRQAARSPWIAACVAILLGAPAALADDAKSVEAGPTPADPSIPIPSDPIAKAAFDFLDKHCSRCHQAGPKLTDRQRPGGGFGNILMLDQVAATPSRIVPGNPDNSEIFKKIANGDMPYDLRQEFDTSKPEPTEQEIASLRTWIQSLGSGTATACASRKLIDPVAMVNAMASDLQGLLPSRVKGTRYLTLTHLYNACARDDAARDEMGAYRAGAIKLLNSLSRRSDVVKLETIDPARTILRFNIDDLGWSADDWSRLIGAYPYAEKPNAPLFDFMTQQTATPLPYIRADWFAYTASRPPLYDALLHLPDSFQELQRQLGLDVAADIAAARVKRAGFQNSGVSANNRLIERHQIATGYFWTSYDFAGNRGTQSLFDFPLGPGGDFGFQHNGGETIFALPDGHQGYFLAKATGEKLATGPSNIVRDDQQTDRLVTDGISCMGCHDNGIKDRARDEIRKHVEGDRRFPRSVVETVEALYPTNEEMDRVLAEDLRHFADALTRSGVKPELRLDGAEPVTALSKRYESPVDLVLAAAEFGLTKEQFLDAAQGDHASLDLSRRLAVQSNVPRDQFEDKFASLVTGLTGDERIDVASAAKAKAFAVAFVRPASQELTRSFDLALYADKNAYVRNELPTFTVRAGSDCFLTLIDVDDKDRGTVLFPNKFQQNNAISAKHDFKFPGDNAPFQFRLQDAGSETIIAVCSVDQKSVDGIVQDFAKGSFTDIASYSRSITRQIVVNGARTRQIVVEQRTQPSAATPAAKPDIVARAAIKITVR